MLALEGGRRPRQRGPRERAAATKAQRPQGLHGTRLQLRESSRGRGALSVAAVTQDGIELDEHVVRGPRAARWHSKHAPRGNAVAGGLRAVAEAVVGPAVGQARGVLDRRLHRDAPALEQPVPAGRDLRAPPRAARGRGRCAPGSCPVRRNASYDAGRRYTWWNSPGPSSGAPSAYERPRDAPTNDPLPVALGPQQGAGRVVLRRSVAAPAGAAEDARPVRARGQQGHQRRRARDGGRGAAKARPRQACARSAVSGLTAVARRAGRKQAAAAAATSTSAEPA